MYRVLMLTAAMLPLLSTSASAALIVKLDADSNSNTPNTDPGVTVVGAWSQSTSDPNFIGANYLHDQDGGKGTKSVSYAATLPVSGLYQVDMIYASDANRATNIPVDIIHDGGTTTVSVDQQAYGGFWRPLGNYFFTGGTGGAVIRNDGTNGFVIADGMRFTEVTQFAQEDFGSYTLGSNINGGSGGTGFNGNWSAAGNNITVQPKTLVATNGQYTSNGQALRINPTADVNEATSALSRQIPTFTGDTLYVGMLVRPESIEGGDFVQFQLSDGAIGNVNETLSFGITNDAASSFFARVGTSTGGDTDLAMSAADETDYLLVAKISKAANGQYERVDLFVDPAGDVEPLIADATAIDTDPSITQLSLFNVRLNSFEADDSLFIDQLVFSNTFAGALLASTQQQQVPEPSAALIWTALIAMGICIARRCRR